MLDVEVAQLRSQQRVLTIGDRERKSAMMTDLPEELEAALKIQANAHGVSLATCVKFLSVS